MLVVLVAVSVAVDLGLALVAVLRKVFDHGFLRLRRLGRALDAHILTVVLHVRRRWRVALFVQQVLLLASQS